MIRKENIHSRMILTDRGLRNENEIVQGDKIIEYGTNNFLEVKDIELKNLKRLYKVYYSDMRTQYVSDSEMILNGNDLHTPEEYHPDVYERKPIEQYPIEFTDEIHDSLNPDPYSAGAIFGYADYTSPYVNLRSHCFDAINHICTTYHYTSAYKGGLTVFQTYKEYDYVTWNEMFGKYVFFARRNRIDEPAIPLNYTYASIHDRKQFIRGIFDAGYLQDDSPDSAAINHWSSDRLEWIQWILLSLGIQSRITTHTKNKYDYKFRLDVIDKCKYWPGLFHDYGYMANMVDTDNRIAKTDVGDPLCIDYIEEMHNDFINELVPHFIFDKENVIGLDAQLLPKYL